MKRSLFIILVVLVVGVAAFCFWNLQALRGAWTAVKPVSRLVEQPGALPNSPFKLKPGFRLSVFANKLTKPRVMVFDPRGVMLVSIPTKGLVVALPDENGDGTADRTETVISGLNKPHGLTFRCPDQKPCELYIAETDQVAVYDYNSSTRKVSNKRALLTLPSDGYNQHYTRSLQILENGLEQLLLVSVGSSCNVCLETDDRRAKILAYNFATGTSTVFARGLRNAVYMTIHPVTGKVWATEMGRDLLGDDIPPDEINIVEQNKNYGWPICYGKNIHDSAFDKNTYFRNPCLEPFETQSHIDIPAHSAPLGLAFIPEEGWPEEYWHNLLVAYHGSWNRSTPTGYKVVRYILDAKGNYKGEEDFMTGWITEGKKYGRPAGVLAQPGGLVYIADDDAGIIYTVRYFGGT